MFTPLSRLFVTERHRLRAANVGHSVPLASELDLDDRSLEPLIVSSTRGTFLQSRISRDGCIRFGFSECPIEREGALLLEFHKQLVSLATANHWNCMAENPEAAVAKMHANGVSPFHMVAGPWVDAEEIAGLPVLDMNMPRGVALVVTTPSKAGHHTRIGDYVGVVAYRVDCCFVAVGST